MYSVKGIPLDNPAKDWILREPSKPLSEIVRRVAALRVPGRNGVVTVPADIDSVTLTFVVQVPRSELESLYSLWLQAGSQLSLTSDPDKVVDFEYLSSTNDGTGPADEYVDVTTAVRLNGVFWRDKVAVTTPAVLLATNLNIGMFDGTSAPIPDALIRITGPVNANVVITDDLTRGQIRYTQAIPAGSAFVYNCDTMTGSIVAAGAWTGGTDVSGKIDFFGPRLALTPYFTTDPGVRKITLDVHTEGGFTAASKVEVQARGAYLV